MKTGVACAVAMLAAAAASLGACTSQQSSQPTTSTSASQSPGTERMTTQLKGTDGNAVANATFDFANGYATVTVEAGPNQVLTPGFHALMVHSVGQCQANSTAPTGGATGDFLSAGDVYQAPNHTGNPASGDLTALEVRPDGSAKLVTTTSAFTASDLRNSSGTALILHQGPGNLGASAMDEAGKRVACGVIATASTTSSTTTSVSTVTTTVAVPPPSTSTSTVTVTSTPTYTTTPTTTTTVTGSNLPPGR
jgi:superoxide dismutase, Cu-Zn family